jgi:hypothetical protein
MMIVEQSLARRSSWSVVVLLLRREGKEKRGGQCDSRTLFSLCTPELKAVLNRASLSFSVKASFSMCDWLA